MSRRPSCGSPRAAIVLLAVAVLLITISSRPAVGSERAAFDRAVEVFAAKCTSCHGGAEPEKGLSLEAERLYRATVNVPARSERGAVLVSPNQPERSYLFRRLLPRDRGGYRGPRMPLDHPPLLDEELNAIRLWIESFPVEMWGAPATPPVAERRIEPARRGEQGMHSTHLGQLPTAETAGRGNLEFRFLHRFRPAVDTAGSKNLFGLDGGADISLGLAYGLSERIDLGLRRTNVDRQLESWGKFRWLEQQAGGSPLSLALFASGARDDEESSAQRSHLAGGIVLQRRFGERFTALLAPLCASRTQIEDRDDRRGTCALGVGGSWRLNDVLALTGEWIAQLSGPTRRYEGGTIGLSIATSRHTFHLLLTNTPDAHTSQYLTGGDLDWGEGDFRLGFNITRSFGLRTGRY